MGMGAKDQERQALVNQRGKLSPLRRLSYGVGHFMNDLCAACWFSYLLVYLHRVEQLSSADSGVLMLVGQIADALSTPTVGVLSDKTSNSFGRRKTWVLLGSVLVGACFPFILGNCLPCISGVWDHKDKNWEGMIMYSTIVAVLQFGWASTQIGHLSLVPELTTVESERVLLNSLRYTFTITANVVIFVLTWWLLDSSGSGSVGPQDAGQFQILAYFVVGLGAPMVLFFLVGTREPQIPVKEATQQVLWRDWLFRPELYQVAVVYMSSRLIVNISQVYLPLYLLSTLDAPKTSIAQVPFVVYGSQFLATSALKRLNEKVGNHKVFLTGLVFSVASGLSFYLVSADAWQWTFLTGLLLGVAGAMVLVTALSMTADIVGEHSESGAFVYGAMSFTDKLSNGVAIWIIQVLDPCEGTCRHNDFYRYVLLYVLIGASISGFLGLLWIWRKGVAQRSGHHSGVFKPLRDMSGPLGPATAGIDPIPCSDDYEALPGSHGVGTIQ